VIYLVRREAALPKTQRAERVPITLSQPYAAHPHARTVNCLSVRLLGEGNRHTDRLGVLQARDFPATAIHSPYLSVYKNLYLRGSVGHHGQLKTTIRLTEADKKVLTKLQSLTGLRQSQIIRAALRTLLRRLEATPKT
jgi:hypothetical protein